jgi:hypothetical protein
MITYDSTAKANKNHKQRNKNQSDLDIVKGLELSLFQRKHWCSKPSLFIGEMQLNPP